MATTETHPPTPKDKHRATWGTGDYAEVAERLVLPLGPEIVAEIGVGPQDDVLDVATGTGNAAIPAALSGARVTGLDLVPDLLSVARGRAAEAGVDVTWVEGDAEALPFEDGRFDVVLSTLGVQFTPDHRRSAHELARTCRPGGRIGLCNWTPEGYIGRFFATLSPYLPPPPAGASPPPRWGSEAHVTEIFEGTGVTFRFERRTIDFTDTSPEAFIDFMAAAYGPLVKAREALTPEGRWESLRSELIAMTAASNVATDGSFRAPSEYLVVVGRKAA
jgi:ubiquinone/menaquinone biosynthesis C-methylase UbiE